MTIDEWEALIYLDLALKLTPEEYQLIRGWQAAGETTFAPVELYSRRREYYAAANNMSAKDIRLLIRIRR